MSQAEFIATWGPEIEVTVISLKCDLAVVLETKNALEEVIIMSFVTYVCTL